MLRPLGPLIVVGCLIQTVLHLSHITASVPAEAVPVDSQEVNSAPSPRLAAMVDKVKRVKALIGGRPIHIEIDGGVSPQTAPLVTAAGADVLVAGAAVFKGDGFEAYRKNIAAIRSAADGAMKLAG